MKIAVWNIEELTGYKPITTFYEDFSIADNFGEKEPYAVADTFRRCFNEWKHNYKYLTELVMVLNWKCWEHKDDLLLGDYMHFWEIADEYACKHLKGEELKYFYDTTD